MSLDRRLGVVLIAILPLSILASLSSAFDYTDPPLPIWELDTDDPVDFLLREEPWVFAACGLRVLVFEDSPSGPIGPVAQLDLPAAAGELVSHQGKLYAACGVEGVVAFDLVELEEGAIPSAELVCEAEVTDIALYDGVLHVPRLGLDSGYLESIDLSSSLRDTLRIPFDNGQTGFMLWEGGRVEAHAGMLYWIQYPLDFGMNAYQYMFCRKLDLSDPLTPVMVAEGVVVSDWYSTRENDPYRKPLSPPVFVDGFLRTCVGEGGLVSVDLANASRDDGASFPQFGRGDGDRDPGGVAQRGNLILVYHRGALLGREEVQGEFEPIWRVSDGSKISAAVFLGPDSVLLGGESGLRVYPVTEAPADPPISIPEFPTIKGSILTDGEFAAWRERDRVMWLDLTDSAHPSVINTLDLPSGSQAVVDGPRLVTTVWENNFVNIQVHTFSPTGEYQSSPRVPLYESAFRAGYLVAGDGKAVVAGWRPEYRDSAIADLSNPMFPVLQYHRIEPPAPFCFEGCWPPSIPTQRVWQGILVDAWISDVLGIGLDVGQEWTEQSRYPSSLRTCGMAIDDELAVVAWWDRTEMYVGSQYLVGEEGLSIHLDPRASDLGFVGLWPTAATPLQPSLNGAVAYYMVQDVGLEIVDLSEPSQPSLVGLWPGVRGAETMRVVGNHLYLTYRINDPPWLRIVPLEDLRTVAIEPPVDSDPDAPPPPSTTRWLGAFPNPFNPRVTLRYALERSMEVELRIYDVRGVLIDTLIDGERQSAGVHDLVWMPHDLPSGVYFAKLSFDGRTVGAAQRLCLLR